MKELANDVTVVGLEEPSAYVQELFAGDGTTTVFQLSEVPFRIAKPTLPDRQLQPARNSTPSSGSRPIPARVSSLGAGGFTLNGGNGYAGLDFAVLVCRSTSSRSAAR